MIQHYDAVFLTDLYEFSMAYTYFKENRHEDIVYFDMFTRKIPNKGGYLIFNGLAKLIEAINNFKFNEAHIEYLRTQGFDDQEFLDYLLNMDLKLDIWAVEDGTVVFQNEPLVTVRGKVIEAQLIETILLLSINYSTLVTTKASRIANAARGRAVLEFGARRAHGYDSSLDGARAAIIAGCVGTSHTLAGQKYGAHVSGTMAHSFIQSYDTELEAFMTYARINPDNAIFLVDTYDTLKSGIPNAIKVAKEYLIPNGARLKAIRLDSGDLAYLSKEARKLLDAAGLQDCQIMASNSLDEYIIDDLIYQGAMIDQFGVGENLITSKSEPVLGGVYKFVAQERDGQLIPKIKVSENIEKITNPSFKRLYRFYDNRTNKALADYIALADEDIPTDEITIFDPSAPWKKKTLTNYQVRELQVPIFVKGESVYKIPTLEEITIYSQKEMETMWDEVKRLHYPHQYYVDLSQKLYDLKLQLLHDVSGK
ncbi:nicotinate phosphoribosyltransferase [Erysipelothrix sp. HDW6C]|uniref:nicotinate phosphoribosyltransferase n=1 Tax=Erysipelothrix sp. HDW6C TaxID=2714930 RepID=UPI00140881AF|nr:nicotinate phosphoribosyltransferase [Erysipelothrix sp. HDW6C]QIK70191.1 nicotinate phosphoribosyltransferase [Erysipelothrix sp. HDW6C]